MTDDSVPAKIAAAFEKLRTAAGELNLVSDRLGLFIRALDQALQPLNLGIEAWVPTLYEDDPVTGDYESHLLGYARSRAKWGIVLRTRVGNNKHDPDGTVEEWPFNEAPRALRIEAVDHLSELIEKLATEASSTTAKISDSVAKAQEVVSAVTMKKAPPQVQTVQQAAFQPAPEQVEATRALERAMDAGNAAQQAAPLHSPPRSAPSAYQQYKNRGTRNKR